MFNGRAFMLLRPGALDDEVRAAHTAPHEPQGSLRPGQPARRGAALPADERDLLLPLGVHRTLGARAAADGRQPDVPRRDFGALLARGRRREAASAATGRIRADAAR